MALNAVSLAGVDANFVVDQPLREVALRDGRLMTGQQQLSGAEQVARWAPGARVVKAFNSIGMEVTADPHFGEARVLLFMCGGDGAAGATVVQLAADIGFDPLLVGPLVRA